MMNQSKKMERNQELILEILLHLSAKLLTKEDVEDLESCLMAIKAKYVGGKKVAEV